MTLNPASELDEEDCGKSLLSMVGTHEGGGDVDSIGMAAGNDGEVKGRVVIQAGGGDVDGVFEGGGNEGGVKSKVGC